MTGSVAAELSSGVHGLQRRAALARGGPSEHTGSVVALADPDFDLGRTIFKSLSGLPAWYQRQKLGVKLYWDEAAAAAIVAAYAAAAPALAAAPTPSSGLLDFMQNECDFGCEHADGSFMDHLRFCHEYSAAHFAGHSPRVLLLHSIAGVATNLFPMAAAKLPTLRGFLSEEEATCARTCAGTCTGTFADARAGARARAGGRTRGRGDRSEFEQRR